MHAYMHCMGRGKCIRPGSVSFFMSRVNPVHGDVFKNHTKVKPKNVRECSQWLTKYPMNGRRDITMSTEKDSANQGELEGTKYLGSNNEKRRKYGEEELSSNWKPRPANQSIGNELIAQGHLFQAHRVRGCGKEVSGLDLRTNESYGTKQRCGYRKLCHSCAYFEAIRAVRSIEEKIEVVRRYDRLMVVGLIEKASSVENQLQVFVTGWGNWKEVRGERTRSRRKLLSELIGISRMIRSLRKVLSTASVEENIESIKKEVEAKGPLSVCKAVSTVQGVSRWLRDSLSPRQNYSFQFITVTLQTRDEDKRNLKIYRRDIGDLKTAIQRLRTYGALAAPGSGVIVSVHQHMHVHAHILYFGPVIEERMLRRSWRAITKTSYIVHVREPLTGDATSDAIRYLFKLPARNQVTVKDLVWLWRATKGQPQITYAGVFSPRTQNKMKRGLQEQVSVVEEGACISVEEEDACIVDWAGPPMRVINILCIDSWDYILPIFDETRARALSILIQHVIQRNAKVGHAPKEEDLLILENLQSIAEGHDLMRSWKYLTTLIAKIRNERCTSIRQAS